MHVLRDCLVATGCWQIVIPVQYQSQFFELTDFRVWLEWNVKQRILLYGVEWRTWFASACIYLWVNRNVGVFSSEVCGSPLIVRLILTYVLTRYRDIDNVGWFLCYWDE